MAWDAKDPQAVRDYGVDWSRDLGTATISTSTWTVIAGTVTVVTSSRTTTTTTVRLAGGADGETAEVLNHIILNDGQEDEKTCRLKVRSQ